jgi:hypothetical protein
MIEIARIFTFGLTNNRDIVRRLMGCCESFKGLKFSDAIATYRYYEAHGLVKKTNEYIVIYHNC